MHCNSTEAYPTKLHGCSGCIVTHWRHILLNSAVAVVALPLPHVPKTKACERFQVVLPFWRTMKVTKQIEQHRLLHPEKPPILISREQLAHVNEDNAYKIFGRTIDVRKIIAIVFDFVFKYAPTNSRVVLLCMVLRLHRSTYVAHFLCPDCCACMCTSAEE